MSFATSLYSAAMYPLSLVAGPLFRAHSRGKVRLSERYGEWNLAGGPYLWFHGASLGEMQGLIPLLRFFRERHPGQRILVSSTSSTGLEAAKQFAHELRLLPFDNPRWIRRALDSISISGFIFGETELWPALLEYLEHRNIPRCMVNARISDKTVRWYGLLSPLFSPHVSRLTAICAGDEATRTRLLTLGANPDAVRFTGNTKYDKTPLIPDRETAREVRSLFLNGSEAVVTLGSIHPEEGEVWFPALESVIGEALRIIIAPRHNERFDHFAAELERRGIPFQRRSALKERRESAAAQVLLLDTLGELESVYSFSTAAFVGGTIRDIGGHNPLEAAMYGVYLCAGRSRWNITEIASQLETAGAMTEVATSGDCSLFLRAVMEQRESIVQKGARGLEVCARSRGATDRTLNELRKAGVILE